MSQQIFRNVLILACTTVISLTGAMALAGEPDEQDLQMFSVDPALVAAGFFPDGVQAAACCIPDGFVDDTLGLASCCSGFAVNGSTVCSTPSDFGTTWASCRHVCGTRPVNGCIPSGGIDDTLSQTRCCGSAVPGSTWCLDPRDFGTDWASCVQRCQ